MGFIIFGAYALQCSMFDVYIAIFFGMIGFIFKKLDVSPAPLVIALILGSITEKNLRQAMTISRGNFLAVISKPISATFLIIALLITFGGPLKKLIVSMWEKRKISLG
jgi:putative tricarboxylic transport membrane protein